MAAAASTASQRVSSKYEYILDVVSNGSEATEPTVFLSVLRRSGSCANSTEIDASQLHELSVLGRYALLGLGENTARLVADQKLAWACTKAVFCQNNHRHFSSSFCPHLGVNGGGLWGLPAILLALNQAGASDLTVVTGNEDDASKVEMMRELTALKAYPRLRIAAVPLAEEDSAVTWWNMYEDEYLVAHATCAGRLEHLIYLFTCRQHRTVENYTMVVLPCPHSRSVFLNIWREPKNRVVLKGNRASKDPKCLHIHSILAVGEGAIDQAFYSDIQDSFPNAHVFFCRPKDRDARVLVRANDMMKSWHKVLPDHIIWREPPPSPLVICDKQLSLVGIDLLSFTSVQCAQPPRILDRKPSNLTRSGQQPPKDDDVEPIRAFFESIVSRNKLFTGDRVVSDNHGNMNQVELADQDHHIDVNEIDIHNTDDEESPSHEVMGADCGSRNKLFTCDKVVSDNLGNMIQVEIADMDHIDVNEIDIDDTEDEESASRGLMGADCDAEEVAAQWLERDEGTKRKATMPLESSTGKITSQAGLTNKDCPHLLVLGTGCAAPSPLRGSSGYGLLFPQLYEKLDNPSSNDEPLPDEALLLTAIFECGEGVLSMLQRHLPLVNDTATDTECLYLHLRHVKFIWISHAHWDHYGGLPAVVSAICEARMQRIRRAALHCNKRSKRGDSESPVLIVAPRQVLKYLESALRCNDDAGSRPYQGFTHEQNPLWWPFLASIHIVRSDGQGRRNLPNSSAYSNSLAYRPFAFWTNVRVEHSCFGAFGFIMGLRVPSSRDFAGDHCGVTVSPVQLKIPLVTFAYSGDTRPCRGFVQRCRRDCLAFNEGLLNYLLHEASFDDAEHALGVEKKHSSLSEALKVAAGACAQKVILTHFSQRYVTYPPMKLTASPFVVGDVVFAMDGMLILIASSTNMATSTKQQ